MPARSDVNAGDVFDGEIMTMPASEISADMATPALEHEVPITPITDS